MRSSSSEDHRDRGSRVRLALVVVLLVAAAAAPVVGRTSAVLTDHDVVELRVTVVTATPVRSSPPRATTDAASAST